MKQIKKYINGTSIQNLLSANIFHKKYQQNYCTASFRQLKCKRSAVSRMHSSLWHSTLVQNIHILSSLFVTFSIELLLMIA